MIRFAGWLALVLAVLPARAWSDETAADVRELNLDGQWDVGIERHYDHTAAVPGLAGDPTQMTPGTLWYRRQIQLPAGSWTQATLTLKGARFAPKVYLNGQLVSATEGGMAPTMHRFALGDCSQPKTCTLEIALQSLRDLPSTDASAVPGADRWRNNVSSYLWDSVLLRLHGPSEITRVIPFSDPAHDSLTVHWQVGTDAPSWQTVRCQILDSQRSVIAESSDTPAGQAGVCRLDLHQRVKAWSPESPRLYRLRVELRQAERVIDTVEQAYGLRDFAIKGLGFTLNGEPFQLRMGTVVWHRWSRDPQAKSIAFDSAWFDRNIVQRCKALGANAMRFHLGLPPERFLDLCDRHGLAVQLEWPFFHGIAASPQSLKAQWPDWLDVACRHPSVVLIHPWNETDGPVVAMATDVLNDVLKDYPPMVVSHREVTPIHKYWWSLFENLGLYYDSAEQFKTPVVADEFGGNYLDGNGDPGLYPETKSAFLRFLGRGNSREERLELHAQSNARVAEYWRRLGVAGFSPFCILGSPNDGNHWFLGPIDVDEPQPKPVWSSLAAAFAPRSVSLELWNRNFAPAEMICPPLWWFNDTAAAASLKVRLRVTDRSGHDGVAPLVTSKSLPPHTKVTEPISIALPPHPGEWRVAAELIEVDGKPISPIESTWAIRTLAPAAAEDAAAPIGVAEEETELRGMLADAGLKAVSLSDPSAKLTVGSAVTWKRIQSDAAFAAAVKKAWTDGRTTLLLDVGPRPLGAGYVTDSPLGGPLEGVPVVSNPRLLEDVTLFGGIHVSFIETAEPESCIQQPLDNALLWGSLPKQATWLWNGLRGGLIVPACDMQISGLSDEALLALWRQRGADVEAIRRNECFAYELAGNYAYSAQANDAAVIEELKRRVRFLVEDAPSLQNVINPNAPVTVTDVGKLFHASTGQARSLVPLANAGKNLNRTPAMELEFAAGRGRLILSQLLTAGRLTHSAKPLGVGVYDLRYDPAAVQVVLNLIHRGLHPAATQPSH